MNEEAPGEKSRRAILQALATRGGGTHKRELGRLTGRGWGTIGHHVYVLAANDAVVTEVHGRLLWVFLPELTRSERDWLVATAVPQRVRILELLRIRPPTTINALSAEMEVSRKVIRTHLGHLQRIGAVKPTDDYPPAYAHIEKKRR